MGYFLSMQVTESVGNLKKIELSHVLVEGFDIEEYFEYLSLLSQLQHWIDGLVLLVIHICEHSILVEVNEFDYVLVRKSLHDLGLFHEVNNHTFVF